MKIFVAIPVYDGKLGVQSVNCLINETQLAIANGDEISFNFMSSDSGIVGGRNSLANDFLESGFDKLFFVDSDVTWEPGALVKLAQMPVDFCGGAYRHKIEEESYPIEFLKLPQIPLHPCGLIEVAKIPTGFMCLTRKVFDTIKEKFPDRKYSHMGKPAHTFFQIKFNEDGIFYGEDFLFCKEWTDLGGNIYLDPEINLTHWNYNPKGHEGRFGDWMRANKPKEESK